MNLLVCGENAASKGATIAALNAMHMKLYKTKEFLDGSSECIFEGDFEHELVPQLSQVQLIDFATLKNSKYENIFLLYEFSAPMDLYAIRALRVIEFLKRYCSQVFLVAPFMPFLREHLDEFRTHTWSAFNHVKIITLDPHVHRENVIVVGDKFFQSEIDEDDVIILPDAGACRYKNHYKNEVICAMKNRQNGITLPSVEKIAGRTCVILDDIISTGYTLKSTVAALKAHKPKKIKACITHNLDKNLDPHAWGLDSLAISDTLIVGEKCKKIFDYAKAFTNLRSIV